jgi:hypothetical protein
MMTNASAKAIYGANAAIALLVTALLGMVGYVVQNKASIAANATQHQLMQEAAERQRAQARAGKQFARVQTPYAALVYSVGTRTNLVVGAFVRAALECGLEGYLATYAIEFVSPPVQPHVTVYYGTNPKTLKAIAGRPFFGTLPPDALARLAADPTNKRARWVELATHTLLPVLHKFVPIIQTKVRRAMRAQRAHSPQCGPTLTARPF